MEKYNKESIGKTLDILKNHGVDKINIRSLYNGVASNYICSTNEHDKIINHIKLQNEKYNVYTTFNYFEEATVNTAIKDNDIKLIKFILLDIDPERPSGTSATHEQKEEAKKVFNNCLEFLTSSGIESYYEFDSGNGYHALIPVNIENSKDNINTLKMLLHILDKKFSSSIAHVDTSVYNPSRITRFYGTLNTKGLANNPEKCHLSQVLSTSLNKKVNGFELIEKIVNNSKVNKRDNINYSEIITKKPYISVTDVEKWLKSNNLSLNECREIDNGKLYKFDKCPMRDHKNQDKGHYFIVNGNKCYFGCHHASCGEQNINSFLAKYPCPKELLVQEKKYLSKMPNIEQLKNGEEFKFGSYILTKSGVSQLEKNGELTTVTTTPLFIKEIIFNRDTYFYNYIVQSISIGNKINEFCIQGAEFNPLSLRGTLSKRGILAYSEVKILAYLQEQMKFAELINTHNKVGWVCYDSLSYNLENSHGSSEKSILNKDGFFKLSTAGTYEEILNLINNDILGCNMEIALSIGLAPIVIGYLSNTDLPDIGTLIINIMGRSSTGKTTALHFIESIYGNPRENMNNFNATSNALLSILNNNFGVATVIDELSSSNIADMTSLIYQIASGQSKQRLNSDSTLKEQHRFNTAVICSSEIGFRSRIKDNPGLRMRLIEMNLTKAWTKDAQSSIKIKEVVNKNYGVLANEFIQKLFKHEKGISLIKKHFYDAKEAINSKLPDSEYKDRISTFYATILSGATLLKELLNIQIREDLLINTFIELEEKEIPNRKGIPENIEQKIIEFIHKNANKFYYDKATTRSYSKIGIIKSNTSMTYADIFTGAFEKFLKVELGIEDFKLAVKRLVDEKIILTTDSKRNNTRTHINGSRVNCYRIELPKDEYNLISQQLIPNYFIHTPDSNNYNNLPIPTESVDNINLN